MDFARNIVSCGVSNYASRDKHVGARFGQRRKVGKLVQLERAFPRSPVPLGVQRLERGDEGGGGNGGGGVGGVMRGGAAPPELRAHSLPGSARCHSVSGVDACVRAAAAARRGVDADCGHVGSAQTFDNGPHTSARGKRPSCRGSRAGSPAGGVGRVVR